MFVGIQMCFCYEANVTIDRMIEDIQIQLEINKTQSNKDFVSQLKKYLNDVHPTLSWSVLVYGTSDPPHHFLVDEPTPTTAVYSDQGRTVIVNYVEKKKIQGNQQAIALMRVQFSRLERSQEILDKCASGKEAIANHIKGDLQNALSMVLVFEHDEKHPLELNFITSLPTDKESIKCPNNKQYEVFMGINLDVVIPMWNAKYPDSDEDD